MIMTESSEREMYRMKCQHYGVEGNCHFLSSALSWGKREWIDINCTPDTDCARMKRYDRLNHNNK